MLPFQLFPDSDYPSSSEVPKRYFGGAAYETDHDLLRLGLSLAMAVRSSDLPGVTTALMIEEMIAGYLVGLGGRSTKANIKEIEPIRRVMRSAKNRQWRHLARERIEDVKPTIPLGPKFWALTKQERDEVQDLMDGDDVHNLFRWLGGGEVRRIELLDAAYWMKGCSSLGLLRYALLVAVGGKNEEEYRLLDIKETAKAAAPRSKAAKIPANNADRVIAGACALSPFLGERMISTRIAGRNVFVRELRPQDMKFELEGLRQGEAVAIGRLMAAVVGRAHGRQLTAVDRTGWVTCQTLRTRR
jgi:uncharacterized protein (DUF2252 family)